MKKSLLIILGLSANLFLIGCADDQARVQIADTNVKLAQIQQSINSSKIHNSQIPTLNKLDDLQNQINQLNGDIDTLKHEQKTYQNTQNQLNQSIEQQLQALQLGSENNTTPAIASSASTNKDIRVNNDNSLNIALDKMKAHDFPNAIKDLKNIVKTSQNTETIAVAQYYLAVCYLANNQNISSIVTARKFVAENPKNKYAPDALRTQYIAQVQAGMKNSSLKTADLLNKNYPDSDANKKVQTLLKN